MLEDMSQWSALNKRTDRQTDTQSDSLSSCQSQKVGFPPLELICEVTFSPGSSNKRYPITFDHGLPTLSLAVSLIYKHT